MDNQNQSKLKLKISRMFRSSFGYCKSVSDVIQRPPPPSDQPHRRHQLIELFSPKVEPIRHTHRDKWSKFVESVDQNCSLAKDRIFPSKKVPNHSPIAPPVSPISPIKHFSTEKRFRKQRRHRKKRAAYNVDKYYEFFSSSSEEDEEDDGTATLFSSRSLSSDSSVSFRGSVERSRMRREGKAVGMNMMMMMMMMPPAPIDMKVKDSLMVVKKSKDPYSDFRNSMVEMIVEKQIFAAKDLENLLQTFLSLNSINHHKVIVEVYTEIWETLFSNSS